MNKEYVRANLDEVTRQEPYYTYYRQRNGKIAEYIARSQHLELADPGQVAGETYEVLARTITKETAQKLNLEGTEDFYGGVVDHLQHVEKSALHLSKGRVPEHYSHMFAKAVQDAVLPGYSFFSEEGAEQAVHELSKRFDVLRLKMPFQSDGHGQYQVTQTQQVLALIKGLDKKEMQHYGAVLEPHLLDAQTISVGEYLGRSFIARQLNDTGEDGRDRYQGALVEVYRQPLCQLGNSYQINLTQAYLAEKAIKVHQAYSLLNPLFSRVSYDILIGRDRNGMVYGGVTDITARVGGTCPALMCIDDALNKDAGFMDGYGKVLLEYDPSGDPPPHAELFIDHPTLRISAQGQGLHHINSI